MIYRFIPIEANNKVTKIVLTTVQKAVDLVELSCLLVIELEVPGLLLFSSLICCLFFVTFFPFALEVMIKGWLREKKKIHGRKSSQYDLYMGCIRHIQTPNKDPQLPGSFRWRSGYL